TNSPSDGAATHRLSSCDQGASEQPSSGPWMNNPSPTHARSGWRGAGWEGPQNGTWSASSSSRSLGPPPHSPEWGRGGPSLDSGPEGPWPSFGPSGPTPRV